jgi:hypothetical protein
MELINDVTPTNITEKIMDRIVVSHSQILQWFKEEVVPKEKTTSLRHNREKYDYNKLVCAKIDGYNQALKDILTNLTKEG